MIRTDRLVLRDFRPSDLIPYCQLREHPDFRRLYPAREVDPDRSAELLGDFIRWAEENPRRRWQLAVEEPRLGLLGSCGVRITDLEQRQASFGCELGREHWGKGYALEAATALFGFAFAELGVHRIHAETLADNRSALSLARRLGMRIEGRHRDSRWFQDRWWDTVTVAILSAEWQG